MSRIGRMPIDIPAGVTVDLKGHTITVKGPKGEVTGELHKDMQIAMEDNVITVTRPSDNKEHRSLHGLTRSLINNMVEGVTKGYSKTLEIQGVGYRANVKGKDLHLTLGFSHPVVIEAPEGVTFEVPAANKIVVNGVDKQVVGALAADIRAWRKPEPYKGKGIRYAGEHVRRKAGKAGAKGK